MDRMEILHDAIHDAKVAAEQNKDNNLRHCADQFNKSWYELFKLDSELFSAVIWLLNQTASQPQPGEDKD